MSTASSPEPFPRRPEFDPASVPADFGGVTLYLPPPRFLLRRRRGPDGRSVADAARSFGPDFDRLLDRFVSASQVAEETGVIRWDEFAAALFDLAADLIGRNYEVDEDRLDSLLVFSPADVLAAAEAGELPEPWGTVWRVAAGLGPKSSGAGSSPPASSAASTPTA